MKKLRSLIKQLAISDPSDKKAFNEIIWQFICYSPKFPLRFNQQLLLDEAEKFSVKVKDDHFSHRSLEVNCFKWGSGKTKVLLTHGWGSKAADFSELIKLLRQANVTIYAFDAPGNGSSEGELSNLILYSSTVEAISARFGAPDVCIGHSLGVLANAIGLSSTPPRLFISLAPLVRLKENFISSLDSQNISNAVQAEFFQTFADKFGSDPAYFNLNGLYKFAPEIPHHLWYDDADRVSPIDYLNEFLEKRHFVQGINVHGVGHERIINSSEVLSDVIGHIRKFDIE